MSQHGQVTRTEKRTPTPCALHPQGGCFAGHDGDVPVDVPTDLPPELRGPMAVMLARATVHVPDPGALRGGTVYEPKWDGYLH